MAQFDVFRMRNAILVVDLQTDLIGIDASRIVAPLMETGVYTALSRLDAEGSCGRQDPDRSCSGACRSSGL